MKLILSTIGLPLALLLTACNKTHQPNNTVSANTTSEMEVEVEVDDGQIIVLVNGEEQVIELGEIMGDIDFENMDGEMSITVMAVTDEDGNEPMHVMKWVSSEGVEDHPQMKAHTMQMRGGHGGPPKGIEEMHEQMMQVYGGHGGSPEGMEEMHEQMMQMRGGKRGNAHGEWRGDYPHGEKEGSEVREFMQELRVLSDVSSYLNDSQAVAMMGIHMIRDELDGEVRMAALETIIEDGASGSPSRNAALIVAIQTMQEAGNNEAAAEYMVELVISN